MPLLQYLTALIIVVSFQRQEGVICSLSMRVIILLELTSPLEDKVAGAHTIKANRCEALVTACEWVLSANLLFCMAHGCSNSRFITAELQSPYTGEHVFLSSVWVRFQQLFCEACAHWVQAPVCNTNRETRQKLCGAGRWYCAAVVKRLWRSPRLIPETQVDSGPRHIFWCIFFFFCQYIFYKDGQIANRS